MIRILHTADWHIDSPLEDYTDLQRRELRSSLLELPGKIADVCLRESCDLALLCGDIFDGPYSREGYESVYRALERMEVPVFVIPGTRDPSGAGSVWTAERWPGNVYLFRNPEPTSFSIRELSCRIFGPVLPEDFRAACSERHAIVLLHGDPADPVTAARVRDSGVDYAALGGPHSPGRFEAGAALCAWPGSPMGRNFSETGTRGVLIAELEENVSLRFVPLEGPRFFSFTVDALSDPFGAVAAVLPEGGSRDHFRIRVTGQADPQVMDLLPDRFREYPNLTILDKTAAPGDPWDGADADTLVGQLLGCLRDSAAEADPAAAGQLELAARICRTLLEGGEVVLP